MGKIVTLDVLKRYSSNDRFNFPKGTIITAEARFWAQEQGLELVVDGQRIEMPETKEYPQDSLSKVVISVIGLDKVGIIAGVSQTLSEYGVNILDISQTTLQGLFVMVTVVDISKCITSFERLRDILDKKGEDLCVKITAQHEDVFNFMHRI